MIMRADRGYTAVEILSALTIFAIGAAGVIGMQRVTIQGGAEAQRFDIANNIAHAWVARLQRDSMYWTLPNATNTSTSNLTTATVWIKDVTQAGCSGAFCIPGTANGGSLPAAGSEFGRSPAFDRLGRDMPKYSGVAGTEHFFCVQYRLRWIADPQNVQCAGLEPCITALIRAEVRVFWNRLEYGAVGDCENLPLDINAANAGSRYHSVYVTTAIRENAVQ
jgi:prepilin-type N-terminal cleavage/methylation domain-containing protein